VLVLAAGLGTRLRPLTDTIPKPLVPLGDRPVLDHVIAQVAGVGPVVVNTFHLGALVGARAEGLGARAVHETTLLGTAGGLRNAAALLGAGDVLVWNADIVAEVEARALLAAHEGSAAPATLVVAARGAGEGTVGLDAAGHVVRLRGEVFGEERAGGEFLGVHVVSPSLRAALPPEGCLVGDLYLPALRAGAKLATFRHDGPFFDVGSPRSYLAANLAWLEQRGLRSWVGPGATVREGVTMSRAIVGAGAHVEASVDAVVVLPGASVHVPTARTIVAPSATIDAR